MSCEHEKLIELSLDVIESSICEWLYWNIGYILSLLWCFDLYSGHGLRYRGFTITLRHTTLGRTPLDEWSSPPRDVCLTIHTHKIQTSVPLGSETAFPASEPPQTHALDRAASGIGIALLTTRIFLKYKLWGLWRAREWIGYSVNDKWTGSHPVSQSVR